MFYLCSKIVYFIFFYSIEKYSVFYQINNALYLTKTSKQKKSITNWLDWHSLPFEKNKNMNNRNQNRKCFENKIVKQVDCSHFFILLSKLIDGHLMPKGLPIKFEIWIVIRVLLNFSQRNTIKKLISGTWIESHPRLFSQTGNKWMICIVLRIIVYLYVLLLWRSKQNLNKWTRHQKGKCYIK